jgi:hypothetical protein
MESNENNVETLGSLLDLGFTSLQIERLTYLRNSYAEREQKQLLMEQRRLEFARWLVSTGRLTDEFPAKRRRGQNVRPKFCAATTQGLTARFDNRTASAG